MIQKQNYNRKTKRNKTKRKQHKAIRIQKHPVSKGDNYYLITSLGTNA